MYDFITNSSFITFCFIGAITINQIMFVISLIEIIKREITLKNKYEEILKIIERQENND